MGDEEKAQAEARALLVLQKLQEDFYKAAYTNDLASLLLASSKGVDINEPDEFGSTALHFAAQHGNTEACAMLLENGAKVDHKNKILSTPLHRAAREGHESVVKLLLEKGANINTQSSDGSTPLHLAAEWDKAEMVRFLLNAGAKADVKNRDEKLPVDLTSSAEVRHYLTKGPSVPYAAPSTSSGTPGATSGSSVASKFFGGSSSPAPTPAAKPAPAPAPLSPRGPPPTGAPPPPPPSAVSESNKPLFAALEKLSDKGLNEKDIATFTRTSVEEIKKIVAAHKATNPSGATELSQLEQSASKTVVAVKAYLTAKAKNEGLAAAQAALASAIELVKANAARLQ